MHYEDLIKDHAPRWPYPVNYGKENTVSGDVLVLGGGIAGCWAAIGAARKGAKVILVEKGATKTSGAGGAGVDHWQCVVTNPACTVSPEEFTQAIINNYGGYRSGITTYIKCRESYDCLLDMEKMGVKVRDSEDEFKGAEFRDEKTKLLFAYDYSAKYTVRVWGANAKSALYRECKHLGVTILDRIMVTSLLTDGGRQGARVVGATGVSSQTGEFYVFEGKATILCMSLARREYLFSTELKGMTSGLGPGNASGDGHAMAWKAGAEFVGGEQSRRGSYSPFGYPMYGVGNAGNTWFACSMIDANGKEIPWVDRDGKLLTTISERYRPAPGQKFFLDGGGLKGYVTLYEYAGPQLMPTLGFNANPHTAGTGAQTTVALPLYSDLPSMPQHERRAIWGLMVGQEGKTLIPIYRTYGQAGFDPDKDLLEAREGGWFGVVPQQWRDASGGGLVVDWDLMTNLDGLFAAGQQIFVSGCHANAAVTGRYAGRHAARYASRVGKTGIDRKQVEEEKTRVYAPIGRKDGMEWKELNAGACRIMQDYCGEVKSEELLTIGIRWFEELETGEASAAFARNPHELGRVLEVSNIISTGKMMMEACRARKASVAALGFKRADYPEMDPPEWRKWVTIRLNGGTVKAGELPLDYHGDFETNYDAHAGL
jgi:succinate dehydrogenase/fumarate reductase flavoprotein subunit